MKDLIFSNKIILLILLLLWGNIVLAETNKNKGNNAFVLETITVTAQKIEENPQEVPVSMDVFSGQQLEDAGVEDTLDLIDLSPNVFIKQNQAEHALVIRGISSFKASTYSPAGFYVDDVSYPLHQMQNIEFFDLKRVEVLKGPQGTLYGRNSESGVINIVTRQPGNTFRAKISGKYAGYNTIGSGVSISGPVIEDKLYIGTALKYDTSDGFTENKADGDDTVMDWNHITGRATLRWTPSDAWDISIIAHANDYDDHGGGNRYVTGPYATESHEVYKDTVEFLEQKNNSQILKLKYKGDTVDILSVSSSLNQRLDKQNDSDMWNSSANQRVNNFKIRERQYSEEIRISSTKTESFKWLAGVYGFVEENTFDYKYDIVSRNMTYMHPVTDIDTAGYALFGQGTYTFWEKSHVTAGLRFDYQTLEGAQRDDVRMEECQDKLTFDEILPKFAIRQDISKDMMAYLNVSKGYLVGGYNWLNATDVTFTYNPEYTWNYETGIKTAWFSGRLISNLSFFYIDIKDKQVTETDYNTLSTSITNAASAHSQGAELQIHAIPVYGLELSAGLGYTESKFDDFKSTEWNSDKTALIENDYEDNFLPYAPKYTFNLGAQYRYGDFLFFRIDLFGADRFYGDSANISKQDAYETVDVKVGWEDERFDIYLWCKNIFDKEYLTYVASSGNSIIGIDGKPRLAGMSVNIKF